MPKRLRCKALSWTSGDDGKERPRGYRLWCAALSGILLFAGCGGSLPASSQAVGYCPTMEPWGREVASDREMDLIRFESAAAVLDALRRGRIEVGVIGRLALRSEYAGEGERLAEGYTLIGPTKTMIPYEVVTSLAITTALPETVVAAHFPELRQVTYVGSTEEALTKGTPVLIDWDEWQDGYPLVIPVHPDGRKVAKFRTPVVYEGTRDN